MKRSWLNPDPEKTREWKRRYRRNNPLKRSELRRGKRINPVNRERRKKRREQNFGEKAEWVRTLGCCVCGYKPVDPHHEPPQSRGGTKEDLTPLCRKHHNIRHDECGSAERFNERFGVDLIEVAERIEKLWRMN